MVTWMETCGNMLVYVRQPPLLRYFNVCWTVKLIFCQFSFNRHMLWKLFNKIMQFLNNSFRIFAIIGTRLSIEFIILSMEINRKVRLFLCYWNVGKGFENEKNIDYVKYIKFPYQYKLVVFINHRKNQNFLSMMTS